MSNHLGIVPLANPQKPWAIVFPAFGRISLGCLSIVGQVFVNWQTIVRQLADRCPTIGRQPSDN